MNAKKILVINPNSSANVTRGLDVALAGLRIPGKIKIDCISTRGAPDGIETQADIEKVIPLLSAIVEREQPHYDAFINACFSDPGLRLLREKTAKPIYGIAESSLFTALGFGKRIGIISILPASVERHKVYAQDLGLGEFLVADEPLNLSVSDLANTDTTSRRLVEVANRLSKRGVNSIIMGCAGMAEYRASLQASFKVPIIDPTCASVAFATYQLTSS